MGNFFGKQKKLIILRGLPGSGKTALASEILKKKRSGGCVFSTNDYFMEDGEYKYNSRKVKDAHLWNISRAVGAMNEGKELIIINNTNIRKWEAKPYVLAGVNNDYNVIFMETDSLWKFDPNELSVRDTHNVSIEVIKKMLREWEDDFTVENVLDSKAPWEL
jgi:predicted kinase